MGFIKRLSSVFYLWLILFSCFLLSAAVSSSAEELINSLNLEDKLSQSTVTAIAQDDQGFIWIGTEDGLNRFDGYTVEVFHKQNSNISHNQIVDMISDLEGNIWVATYNGLSVFQQSTGKFINYFHNPVEPYSIADDYIVCLAKNKAGGIWLGTYQGASYFDPALQGFKSYPIVDQANVPISVNEVSQIVVGDDERVWVGTTHGQIALFDPKQEHFKLQGDGSKNEISGITAMAQDQSGILWLSNAEDGLFQFNPETAKITRVELSDVGIDDPFSRIRDIIISEDNVLWLGTKSKGLYSFDINRGQTSHYTDKFLHRQKTGNSMINKLYSDKLGVIWIGTNLYLNKLNPDLMRFNHLYANSGETDELVDNSTFAVEVDSSNRLWVGSEYDGMTILDKTEKGYQKNLSIDTSVFKQKAITDIEEGAGERIWIIADNELWLYDGVRNSFSPHTINQLKSASLYTLNYHNQQLWITSDQGFWQIVSDDEVKLFQKENKSYSEYNATQSVNFTDDNKGAWLATNGGLLYYDFELDKFTTIHEIFPQAPSQLDQEISSVYIDRSNRLWVGTYGLGLIFVDLIKKEFKVFDIKNSSLNKTIYSIQPDSEGNIWVGTGKGLYRFDTKNFSNSYFSISEEQPIREFNSLTSTIDKQGNIYMGGVNGLIYFDPKDYSEDFFPPEPVITKVLVNNEPVRIGAGEQFHSERPVNLSEQLVFSFRDFTIQFEFSGMHYSDPQNNHYRYQLVGSDVDWVEVDALSRTAIYSNLSPGDYLFKVMASNKDGVWSEKARELKITVLTSPFLSPLAFAAYGLILGSIILAFTYLVWTRLLERRRSEAQIQESEERLKLSLWGTGDELWDWDITTGGLHLSNEWKQDFPRDGIRSGYSEANSNIHPNDIAYVKQAIKAHLSGKSEHFESTYRINDENGNWIWVLDRGKCVEFVDDKPVRMAGTLKNITELKDVEQQLSVIVKSFDNISDAVWILDDQFIYIAVNQSFQKISGYQPEEVLGHEMDISVINDYSEHNFEQLIAHLEKQGSWQGELEAFRKNGQIYPIDININVVRNNDGVVVNYVGVFSDITFRRRAEEELRRLATTDQLTNLPNRNTFKQRVAAEIKSSDKFAQHALLFIDLDNFKRINDSLGHSVGDELLVTVAEVLENIVNGTEGIVARQGGDEFTVFLPNIETWNQPAKISQSILDRFSRTLILSKNEIVVSPSIGIVMYPENGDDSEELLRNADTAMYYAKKKGKNTYQFYTKQMNEQAKMRLNLENELRQAIDKDEFVVYYQPKVCLDSGKITGLEALIRWHHPERGLVLPNEFIPLAEEAGFIIPMSRKVIEKTCLQIKDWLNRDLLKGKVAINLSAIQFYHENLWETVKNALHLAKIGAEHIEFEITEGMVMQDLAHSIQQMNTLREMGITLALDDFGVGYSSLGNLKDFPINTLKIDRSFVWDLEESERDRQLVSSIVTLAHNLDIKVVAEGVETLAQVNALKAMKCEEIQGFIYSKPLPPWELEKLLSDPERSLDKVLDDYLEQGI